MLLGVNIDHVASLRQARYRASGDAGGAHAEPDPVRAAHEAELGGADIVTAHLREDRRHLHDRDLALLAQLVRARLNLEMSMAPAMIELAVRLRAAGGRPEMVTLVPEGRNEVTTEGGLDVAGAAAQCAAAVASLKGAAGGLCVSAFIDPDPAQVEAAHGAGFDAAELHTGQYANAFARCGGDAAAHGAELRRHVARLIEAGHRARALGMRLNLGHGLNYLNLPPLLGPRGVSGVAELHIGHAIVARAVYTGLRAAVADMRALIRAGPGPG
ncbi:MAG: pyridoxine 5'-phosphate synthase [Planctomyces sp.]|nr:pyridoxine 5'-phosphate synthase [Planctomyces sp.]